MVLNFYRPFFSFDEHPLLCVQIEGFSEGWIFGGVSLSTLKTVDPIEGVGCPLHPPGVAPSVVSKVRKYNKTSRRGKLLLHNLRFWVSIKVECEARTADTPATSEQVCHSLEALAELQPRKAKSGGAYIEDNKTTNCSEYLLRMYTTISIQ